ncbi:ATP-binding cassette transporter [Dorcoceras hygrometricum]|uniref:ATP-binding cassette transporter n=1 Tax=Dorcoceras hygrometricum TaxID=472368 RepID=A0A2Z6ZXH5_9LAMI|nr:ATP-binding cassette transporter [Dorcoceras hygrometricum]
MRKLLLTNLLAVASISIVDESINIRHSRSYEEELQAGAGAGLMKKSAGELSVDDISSDVIIQQEATIQQEEFALSSSRNLLLLKKIQAKQLMNQTQATAASSRRAYMNQLLLINQSQALHIQSTWFPGAKNRRSSKAQQLKNESAAKQLTTYEEISKMDVNC